MKKQNVIIISLALAVIVGTVSFSVANGPANNGQMGCGMMMAGQSNSINLTAEQQQKAQIIEKKYQEDLNAGETAIRNKGTELDKALANGSTTVATLNNLRDELAGLEQEYWQIRKQANGEISEKIGTAYYGAGGWGPDNCSWHNNHGGQMMGRGMMHGRNMMGSNHMGGMYCCR